MEEKFIKDAQFKSYGNDLFWDVLLYENGKFTKLKWKGYDDAYWWKNVAPKRGRQVVDGRTFEIDFEEDKVYEIKDLEEK